MFIRTVTKDTVSQKQSDFNRTHCIIIIMTVLPSLSIPEGGLKIDEIERV